MTAPTLYPDLTRYLLERAAEGGRIGADRCERLLDLVGAVRERLQRGEPARLTFVCTHNSRRSQMAQILSWALAAHHRVEGVSTFSAGTEVTAVAPPVVTALAAAGFHCVRAEGEINPVVEVRYGGDGPILRAFSKLLDDASNPAQDFCAVMTCSEADANCPLVPGASQRISLPYEDPKPYDGSEQEARRYAERCGEIARELSYVFSQL